MPRKISDGARFRRFMRGGLYNRYGILNAGPHFEKELAMGIEVEQEHADGDLGIAERIALDHLVEHARYYSKLKAAGL